MAPRPGHPTLQEFWGIQGPGIAGPRQEWQHDHALTSWRHFWRAETERRGGTAPEVIERYPYLAGGKPDMLPGIDDLAELTKDAVVVSTADSFHHGIGYGTPADKAAAADQEGIELARKTIQEGIDIRRVAIIGDIISTV